MRWPWKREHVKAEMALREAQEQAAKARGRWPKIHSVNAAADQQARQNNFALTIARALGEHR